MASLHSDVLDNGLATLTSAVNAMHICSTLPTTYTEAITTYTLGNKSAPTVGSPAARSPNGRKVTVSAVTDGLCTANGTAGYYALVATGTSRLLAAGTLSNPQAVINGNPFTTTAIDIGVPAPA